MTGGHVVNEELDKECLVSLRMNVHTKMHFDACIVVTITSTNCYNIIILNDHITTITVAPIPN